MTREPTARQEEAWEALQRLGSQTAAARELGLTQRGVRDLAGVYMAKMGIPGPVPNAASGGSPAAVELAEERAMRREAEALLREEPAWARRIEAKLDLLLSRKPAVPQQAPGQHRRIADGGQHARRRRSEAA